MQTCLGCNFEMGLTSQILVQMPLKSLKKSKNMRIELHFQFILVPFKILPENYLFMRNFIFVFVSPCESLPGFCF